MLYASAVMAARQRRRWAAVVERQAPPRCAVAAAADVANVQRERFLAILRLQIPGDLRLDSELSREEIVAALNRRLDSDQPWPDRGPGRCSTTRDSARRGGSRSTRCGWGGSTPG